MRLEGPRHSLVWFPSDAAIFQPSSAERDTVSMETSRRTAVSGANDFADINHIFGSASPVCSRT
ncbi:hypothetical protein T11_8764 [Trichinella zimbabwensis]|uniref:Uncharacterized protein n=1 Tax=Trichinella zimbabwensis TaxID=268475 RepID=A0A0V1GSB9_9BILA|nr:hypothetical protein T11_8764 [Trichinella zimbabwensis]